MNPPGQTNILAEIENETDIIEAEEEEDGDSVGDDDDDDDGDVVVGVDVGAVLSDRLIIVNPLPVDFVAVVVADVDGTVAAAAAAAIVVATNFLLVVAAAVVAVVVAVAAPVVVVVFFHPNVNRSIHVPGEGRGTTKVILLATAVCALPPLLLALLLPLLLLLLLLPLLLLLVHILESMATSRSPAFS